MQEAPGGNVNSLVERPSGCGHSVVEQAHEERTYTYVFPVGFSDPRCCIEAYERLAMCYMTTAYQIFAFGALYI